MKRKLWCVVAALSLATPALAFAQDGYVVDNVNLRAGPDASYPLVDQLPAGTQVGVQGCTDGYEWCDVIADGNRGWIAGNYIQYRYQDQPVYLSDYGSQIGIPIVAFSVGTYWDRYYRSRPFYGDRGRWYNQPYGRRAPPPPPRGYPGRGPDYGRVHDGDYGRHDGNDGRHDGNHDGQPGSGYQRPEHPGPVSPGYPVRQPAPGGRPFTPQQGQMPQPGQGQVGRPGNGQAVPGQPNGRPQGRPDGNRTDGHGGDHHDNDHPDNNGH